MASLNYKQYWHTAPLTSYLDKYWHNSVYIKYFTVLVIYNYLVAAKYMEYSKEEDK